VTAVRDLLRHATQELRRAGVATARLDAELLLASALGTGRAGVLARLAEGIGPAEERAFRRLLERRVRREPVAYILGHREFRGRDFAVTPDVLIPRPETELLVERALELATGSGVAVDVGTGSGCVAVTLAAERPGLRVYATDTSPAALALARRNARRHGVEDRIALLPGSLLAPVPERATLALANLPYVPSGEIATLEPDVRAWEPRAALDGGEDGLDLVRALLPQLPGKTEPGAVCLLEIDPRQFGALEQAVAAALPGWSVSRLRDLSGRDRVAELRALTAL
jgi:release factor glutamine methyltransferase